MNGRQLVLGPSGLANDMSATRKTFVPSSGGFMRFFDTITNSGAADATVDIKIESAFDGPVHTLVSPASTGNTYAVTVAPSFDNPCVYYDGYGWYCSSVVRPSLSHVFAGPQAPVTPTAVHIQANAGSSYDTWRITIPAGQSISLLHFAVQRQPSDTAGAQSQAEALTSLTDPNALAGLTPAELARIVNFKIQ
jgi:hypothetical protein